MLPYFVERAHAFEFGHFGSERETLHVIGDDYADLGSNDVSRF